MSGKINNLRPITTKPDTAAIDRVIAALDADAQLDVYYARLVRSLRELQSAVSATLDAVRDVEVAAFAYIRKRKGDTGK